MRIIVMSDSHGVLGNLAEIVKRNLTADLFVHLGDGIRELDDLRVMYPQFEFKSVRGNCDMACSSPDALVFNAGNAKIIAVHGHNHGVNYGLETLKKLAEENGANVALFGHTHVKYQGYEDGIYFLNPGSASSPRDSSFGSYGYIDVTDAGIVTNTVKLT